MRTKVRMSLVPFLVLAVVSVLPAGSAPPPARQPFQDNGIAMVPGPRPGQAPGGPVRPDCPPPLAPPQEEKRTLVSLAISRSGTLNLPASLREGPASLRVGPGTYTWVLRPGYKTYTWTFAPAETGLFQSLSVTYDGSAYRPGPNTRDMTAALNEADFANTTSLTLPPGFRSFAELCWLPRLTRLVVRQGLDYAPDQLQALLAQAPGLKELELTGSTDLPGEPDIAATDEFPYRLETPNGIFLGDRGMSMAALSRYAKTFESTTVGELERDTGLRPTRAKAVFLLYGDEAHWNKVTGESTFWGYYTAQDHLIHMAHWKAPESVNTVLLAHEFFHWLAWEEGRVNLPTWLNEGLAHNLSWRVEQHADTWLNPYVRREWLRVANSPKTPVPALSSHSAQDEYTITAVAHLLQTRGRDALVPFFERTRDGMGFAEAFRLSFGVTTAEYESEYRRQVQEVRKGR